MQVPANTLIQARLLKWSTYLVILAALIAAVALTGWWTDLAGLRNWGQALSNMNPLGATLFLFSTLAFAMLVGPGTGRPYCTIGYGSAYLVLGLIMIQLISMALHMDAKLDTILFHDRLFQQDGPYRMAPKTLVSFGLINLSLICLPYRTGRKWKASHVLLIPVILLTLFSVLSYVYRGVELGENALFNPMPVNTSVCFLLFALAILFATPGQGFMKDLTSDLTGSGIARVLVPTAVIVPALLGLVRLWGYRQGYYNNEFGIALLTVATIIIFFAVVWYNTVVMNRRDLQRLEATQALSDSEEQVKAIFSNAPDAIVIIDKDGAVVRWNPEAEHLFGWTSEEVTGELLSNVIIPIKVRDTHLKGLQRFIVSSHRHMIGRSIEIFAIRKNETHLDISLTISPLTLQGREFYIGFIRNITEKKKNEARLRSFNDELSRQVKEKTREITDVFERVTDGFIALDKDFRYTYMNKRAGEMTRRDPSELIGKNVWEEFPGAIDTETYKAFHKAMREQQYVMNTEHFEPLELWQENHIYPSPNGLSIFIRDITEGKLAERRITQVRNLADKLIDSLPGIFYFYDSTGKFIRWNKRFEEVSGYSGEEIANMHPLQFFDAADHAYMQSRIQETFVAGMSDAEANFISRKGEAIPYYFRAALLNFEGKPCLLGTGIDVREKNAAEKALKASEQQYKLLFENNPMPMFMIGPPPFMMVDVNTAALKQYGYTREQFMKLSVMETLDPEEKERVSVEYNPEFEEQRQRGIWKQRRRDGSLIFTDIVTHDIFYKNQAVRLVLASNVTEQLMAREQLEESYDSIRKLTEYLQNIREEERLHISREIHDELGQLLTVLKMDVSWLNKKIDAPEGPVRAKITELLGLIDTTVKTVRRIASELRPTLLDDLGIQAAMEWHLEEFERRSGITQDFEPPGREIPITDAQKIGLFRIFQESLTNVARHSGGSHVRVALKEEDNHVILTIRDNGRGFNEESTRKNTLGLLGMKERTKVMGGQYTIESEEGAGTMVKVMVPLVGIKANV